MSKRIQAIFSSISLDCPKLRQNWKSIVQLNLGLRCMFRGYVKAIFFLIGKGKHFLLLWFFIRQSIRRFEKFHLKKQLSLLCYRFLLCCPFMGFGYHFLLLPLDLQAILLFQYGSFFHSPLRQGLPSSVKHVRFLVCLQAFILFSFSIRDCIDFVLGGQSILWRGLLLPTVFLGVSRLLTQSHAQILLIGIFCLRWFIGIYCSRGIWSDLGVWIICGLAIRNSGRLGFTLWVLGWWNILRVFKSLFWRNIFFRPWIKYLFSLWSGLFIIQNVCIADIDKFSFVFGQPLQRYVHLFVGSPVVHLKGEDFVVPDFSRQILWRLDYFGMMHFLKSIFNFISVSISSILDHSYLFSLFDLSPLLQPPFPSLLQPSYHILSCLYVCQIAQKGEQFLMRTCFILVADQLFEDSFVVETQLITNSFVMLLVLDERI